MCNVPHLKALGMINLQYGIRICHKSHNEGRMCRWQIQVTIFLSETDVKKKIYQNFLICSALLHTVYFDFHFHFCKVLKSPDGAYIQKEPDL